jgi:hypothetical protein
MLPRIWRRRLTPRVLHWPTREVGDAIPGSCPRSVQIPLLQDLLQAQDRTTPPRRGVLGCGRPSSQWRPPSHSSCLLC